MPIDSVVGGTSSAGADNQTYIPVYISMHLQDEVLILSLATRFTFPSDDAGTTPGCKVV